MQIQGACLHCKMRWNLTKKYFEWQKISETVVGFK